MNTPASITIITGPRFRFRVAVKTDVDMESWSREHLLPGHVLAESYLAPTWSDWERGVSHIRIWIDV